MTTQEFIDSAMDAVFWMEGESDTEDLAADWPLKE